VKIKIVDIQIEERQRESFGDLHSLADSIAELGQLVPIIVEKGTLQLIAGERRLQAMKLLEKDTIEVVFQEDLTPVLRRKIELAENVHRKDLTWYERVNAIAELVELARSEAPPVRPGPTSAFMKDLERDVSYDALAKEIGVSRASLIQDLELAAALKTFPQLADEDNKTTAVKRYKRALSTVITKELLSRGDIKKRKELLQGNAEELIKTVGDETVDLILFDPPFGIDLATTVSASRTGSGEGTYEFDDTLARSRTLCIELFPQFHRVMKEPAAAFVFFPVQYYQWFYETLVGVFGVKNVFKVPLIWAKGRGGTLWTGYSFSGAYEAFFFVRKGKITLLADFCDVFSYPRVSGQARVHVAEKPVELYKDLIMATTQIGGTVLDPTFGSGASMEASLLTHRKAVGFEMSEAVYARACERLDGIRVDDIGGEKEDG